MNAPPKPKKQDSRYEYQKKKVPCNCEKCNGRLVPSYMQRDHAAKANKNICPSEDEEDAVKLSESSAFKRLAKRQCLSRGLQDPDSSTVRVTSSSHNPVAQSSFTTSHQHFEGPLSSVEGASAVCGAPPSPCHAESASVAGLGLSPACPEAHESRSVSRVLTIESFDVHPSISPSQQEQTHSCPDLQDFRPSSPGSPRASGQPANTEPSGAWPPRIPDPSCVSTPAVSERPEVHTEPPEPNQHNLSVSAAPFERPQSATPGLAELPRHEEEQIVNPADSNSPMRDSPSSPAPIPLRDLPQNAPAEVPLVAHAILGQSADTWYWRVLLLLTTWLHLHYHLPYRACTLILQVLRLIFTTLGLLQAKSNAPVTLQTAITRLHLADNFEVKAMCPTCRRVYPANSPPDLCCTACTTPLFKRSHATIAQKDTSSASGNTGHVPRLQAPYRVLSAQLPEIVSRLETSLDSWRTRAPSPPGHLRCVQDGKLWSSLPGPNNDQQPFFYNGPDRHDPTELRIGITLGFDGFGYQRSQYAGKHSTGVLSNCLANLETHEKYQSRNLILCGLTPGPKELTTDELQLFLKEYVGDLLHLYDEGIVVKTPLFPDGRRVRVILIAVCCDHPALCRMCGFGDHNTKSAFCTRCKIPHDKLSTQDGMTIDAFPRRDGDEHRRHAQEYAEEEDPQNREALFKLHATRYYELSRLPYFDPVRMSVIDPMHNILLGIVKTQWYNNWIEGKALRERTSQKKVPRELDQIHEYLKKFEMPQWVARLPSDVGYPAGGSLTADEWKGMALNYCPVIIPLIWDHWQPLAEKTYQKSLANWTAKEQKRLQRKEKGKQKADDTAEPKAAPMPQRRMHAEDADIFLCLAAALKIILARSVDIAELPRGRTLLQDYLQRFQKLHSALVKPNFHYVTHIFEQIEDYGPVYGFWTFLSERLNKVLKSYATNNHDGGELEVTFFRAFSRDVRLRRLLADLAIPVEGSSAAEDSHVLAQAAALMLKTDGDQRGTIAALSNPNLSAAQDMTNRFSLDGGVAQQLTRFYQRLLLTYYKTTHPHVPIYDIADDPPMPTAHFLTTTVRIHGHIVMDGHRIVPSRGVGLPAPDSIIQVNMNNQRFVGEVFGIFTHRQSGIEESQYLLHVRWFRRMEDVDTNAWDPYPELEVMFWEHGVYLDPSTRGPSAIVPFSAVLSQACRITIKYPMRPPGYDSEASDPGDETQSRADTSTVWVTTGLTRDAVVL